MYHVLRETRKNKNISVIQLTLVLGLKTTGTYYKKEQGNVPITIEEAKKLSKILGVSIEKLFS